VIEGELEVVRAQHAAQGRSCPRLPMVRVLPHVMQWLARSLHGRHEHGKAAWCSSRSCLVPYAIVREWSTEWFVSFGFSGRYS
jgi:hypothetical protein